MQEQPEVLSPGSPTLSPDAPVIKFLRELPENANSETPLTNDQVFDKLMELARNEIQIVWDSRLPQTAELHFNYLALAFSTIQQVLLHRHGVTAVSSPEQTQPAKSKLII